MDLEIERQILDSCLVRLDVTIPEEEASRLKKSVIQKIKNTVRIGGYRKGRVPDEIILTRFRNLYRDELRQLTIDNTINKALEKANISYIFDLEVIRFRPEDKIFLSLSLEVPPQIDFGILKNQKITIATESIKESWLNKRIEDLRISFGRYEKSDEPIGDSHVADILYKIEGDENPRLIQIATFTQQDGFAAILSKESIGKKKGQKFKISVSSSLLDLEPEADVDVEVEIVQVYRATLPDLDDDFAKSAGYKDLKHLKDSMYNKLQYDIEVNNKQKALMEISKWVYEKNPFRLPDRFTESRMNNLSYSILKRPPSELNYQMRNMLRLLTHQEVIRDCVFYSYIEQKSISIDQDELKDRIKLLASFEGISPDLKRAQMERDRLIDSLKKDLLFFKALDNMVQEYSITIIREETGVSDTNSSRTDRA